MVFYYCQKDKTGVDIVMEGESAWYVVSAVADIEDAGPVTVYGIAYRDEHGQPARIDDISTDRGTVERLAAMLRDGNVSPLHVYDIVCDFVAEL